MKLTRALILCFFTLALGVSYAQTSNTVAATPSDKIIKLQDLGEFQKSVEKFGDKAELGRHHQRLLDNATNPSNSVIKRYTYALLLGINEPTLQTRKMSVEALDKLIQDPSLSQSDKTTITEIRNMIEYKIQEAVKSA